MFAGKTEQESRAFEERFFDPTGAMVMGRRMFDLGVEPWGDNPTFHMPVFVVTHNAHEPIIKKGGTTYFFVPPPGVVESDGVVHLRYRVVK
jgi:dihydrofolate reductase